MQKTVTFRTPMLLPAPLLATDVLSGCSLAPTYERPDAPVTGACLQAPTGYAIPTNSVKPDENAPRTTELNWCEFFSDTCPWKLINLMLRNSRDLRAAVLNVGAARTRYRLQIASPLPPVNAPAMYTHDHTPPSIPTTGGGIHTKQYQLGMDISDYQANLFSVDGVISSARASCLTTGGGWCTAQISLISQVAKVYLSKRAYIKQPGLAQQTLKGHEDYYKLAKQRFDIGVSPALGLRQTETLVESMRVSVAQLMRQYAQATNTLILLVGTSLPADLPASAMMSPEKVVADILPGLPSKLLEQYPDIHQTEQKLIAANANIGVTRAALFPGIGLTSNVGTTSGALHDLFKSETQFWSFILNLTLPIFNWDANIFSLDLTKTNQKTTVANYEKTIQTVFRRVPDALVVRDTPEERMTAQKRFCNATADHPTLSDQRYRDGVSDFLGVLDAQHDLFSTDQTLVQTHLTRLTNAIDLYMAPGGGLQKHSTTAATQQTRPTAALGIAFATPSMTPQQSK